VFCPFLKLEAKLKIKYRKDKKTVKIKRSELIQSTLKTMNLDFAAALQLHEALINHSEIKSGTNIFPVSTSIYC
jgi:hypothetical protein